MAANDSTDSISGACCFDYVSSDFIDDFCARAASEFDSEDFASFAKAITSFFQKFHLTDVILFRKVGKFDSKFCDVCKFLFNESDSEFNGTSSIRYYRGVEIETENEKTLFSLIRKERQNADFLTVRSSDEKIIRAAADSPEVDAVIPIFNDSQKQSVGKINHIVAKIAQNKKTAFGFDLLPFLQTRGYRRSKLFSGSMEMIPILMRYNVPILLFSGAQSVYDFRGTYELEAFGRLLGISQEQTKAAVGFDLAGILQRRKDLKSGKIIMDGVEIVGDFDEIGEDFSETD